jgi:hypothetical protein
MNVPRGTHLDALGAEQPNRSAIAPDAEMQFEAEFA